MPAGYQRLGQVLIVRLVPVLAPYRALLGAAWREELGVATVLARTGPISGELRSPHVERLTDGPTETEVVEHGTRWRLDAAEVMFAAGNRTERQRFARAVRAGERVADLFAGIGYFTLPAARVRPDATFVAVEKNPVAYRYLEGNAARNGVAERVLPILGDNRRVALEPGAFDRVVLGYLPSSLPWLGRAIRLLPSDGGVVHVHLVADARGAVDRARDAVGAELARCGATSAGPLCGREVKPYGPGRTHVVVDAPVRPAAAGDGDPRVPG
jgi:tRNA wybutosine-synthesizing protein 2